jgi:hypothetical protein
MLNGGSTDELRRLGHQIAEKRAAIELERRRWEVAVVRLVRPKTCAQLLGLATGAWGSSSTSRSLSLATDWPSWLSRGFSLCCVLPACQGAGLPACRRRTVLTPYCSDAELTSAVALSSPLILICLSHPTRPMRPRPTRPAECRRPVRQVHGVPTRLFPGAEHAEGLRRRGSVLRHDNRRRRLDFAWLRRECFARVPVGCDRHVALVTPI